MKYCRPVSDQKGEDAAPDDGRRSPCFDSLRKLCVSASLRLARPASLQTNDNLLTAETRRRRGLRRERSYPQALLAAEPRSTMALIEKPPGRTPVNVLVMVKVPPATCAGLRTNLCA